jgi:hypothetical protein
LQEFLERYDGVAEMRGFKDREDILLCWYSGEIEVVWHNSFEGWVEVVLGSDILEYVWVGELVYQ